MLYKKILVFRFLNKNSFHFFTIVFTSVGEGRKIGEDFEIEEDFVRLERILKLERILYA